MSNVPEARLILAEVIEHLRKSRPKLAARLEAAEALLYREPYARPRAPDKSRGVDKAAAEAMRRYATRNPDVPLSDVAQLWKVNPGRVSEALHGKR